MILKILISLFIYRFRILRGKYFDSKVHISALSVDLYRKNSYGPDTPVWSVVIVAKSVSGKVYEINFNPYAYSEYYVVEVPF